MPGMRIVHGVRHSCALSVASYLLTLLALLTVLATLGGCAGLFNRDPMHVSVAGIEPIGGEGLEMRFDVKLRLQNPNETSIAYDGVALDLELNGRPFASGVSGMKGTLPRFGETVVDIPVTVSAFAAARQAFALADGKTDSVPYVLRGKLGGGPFGATRFSHRGTLRLPDPAHAP